MSFLHFADSTSIVTLVPLVRAPRVRRSVVPHAISLPWEEPSGPLAALAPPRGKAGGGARVAWASQLSLQCGWPCALPPAPAPRPAAPAVGGRSAVRPDLSAGASPRSRSIHAVFSSLRQRSKGPYAVTFDQKSWFPLRKSKQSLEFSVTLPRHTGAETARGRANAGQGASFQSHTGCPCAGSPALRAGAAQSGGRLPVVLREAVWAPERHTC